MQEKKIKLSLLSVIFSVRMTRCWLFSCIWISYVYDFTDIDECKGNHSCHVNAACMNTLGSHVCQCHAGYTGNGANCTGKFNLSSPI